MKIYLIWIQQFKIALSDGFGHAVVTVMLDFWKWLLAIPSSQLPPFTAISWGSNVV